jgi:hypothetical protein
LCSTRFNTSTEERRCGPAEDQRGAQTAPINLSSGNLLLMTVIRKGRTAQAIDDDRAAILATRPSHRVRSRGTSVKRRMVQPMPHNFPESPRRTTIFFSVTACMGHGFPAIFFDECTNFCHAIWRQPAMSPVPSGSKGSWDLRDLLTMNSYWSCLVENAESGTCHGSVQASNAHHCVSSYWVNTRDDARDRMHIRPELVFGSGRDG